MAATAAQTMPPKPGRRPGILTSPELQTRLAIISFCTDRHKRALIPNTSHFWSTPPPLLF
jgi:hypothetical protein